MGPVIETKSYINTEAFRHLEGGQSRSKYNNNYSDRDGIDDRSIISPAAFRHLEFDNQYVSPYQYSYASYGLSDV